MVPYCHSLRREIESQQFNSSPVRVRIDDRDIRGGEKKWQWVKRGVPVRIEVGPRDIAEKKLSVGRRDMSGKPNFVLRDEFIANVGTILAEIQQGLFDRAEKARTEATVSVDQLPQFEEFFAEGAPGGLAYCHFVDGPEMEAKLKQMKVTVRCVPIGLTEESGKCLFTGQPSTRRGVFARAY